MSRTVPTPPAVVCPGNSPPLVANFLAAPLAVAVFDSLPDDALVKSADVRMLLGNISEMTEWRWRRENILPKPISIRRRNYYRVGDIRAVRP